MICEFIARLLSVRKTILVSVTRGATKRAGEFEESPEVDLRPVTADVFEEAVSYGCQTNLPTLFP